MSKVCKASSLYMLIHINNRVLSGDVLKSLENSLYKQSFDRDTLWVYINSYIKTSIDPYSICPCNCIYCINRNKHSSIFGFTCSILIYINKVLITFL